MNALNEAFKLPAVIGLGDTKVAYRDVYHQQFVFGLDKTVFKEKKLFDWVTQKWLQQRKTPSRLL